MIRVARSTLTTVASQKSSLVPSLFLHVGCLQTFSVIVLVEVG